ncbi:hypothetical protein [Rhizobium sp. YTU87027]
MNISMGLSHDHRSCLCVASMGHAGFSGYVDIWFMVFFDVGVSIAS